MNRDAPVFFYGFDRQASETFHNEPQGIQTMSGEMKGRIPNILPNITTRIIGGEAFIMSLDTVRTFSLNETAARVWTLIDGTRTVGDIIDVIKDEYDVPSEVCESSINGIIEKLRGEHLIDFTEPHER